MNRSRLLLVFALALGWGAMLHAQQPTRPVSTLLRANDAVFAPGQRPSVARLPELLRGRVEGGEAFSLVRVDLDGLGMEHHVFQQTHLGYPVEVAIQKAHVQAGEVMSLHGQLARDFAPQNLLLSEADALAAALRETGVERLQADHQGSDAFLQQITGNPFASWRPKGTLVYAPNTLSQLPGAFRLAWKFDIYSAEPLFRAFVYVDAETGALIWRNESLHSADAQGIGHTHYSGVRAIVTDSVGGYYRLREAGRALGVETYDMLNQTDYQAAVDVTQFDNVWDSFPTPPDAGALDAHWGAEMTYDYYMTFHNRNSYDNLASKLISYVHFDNNYSNAYWNGMFMTYGDGGGNNTPFSGLDVCGHEFTHGVTEYTAGLIYQDEPGALNESFSDIFGNAIEFWSRPTNASWTIGDDIGAFRSMSNPQVFFNPDTYQGSYWASPGGFDNGGVHNNSGVQNYWFYLMSDGGSGVNDHGDSYNVSGLGIDTAAQIAYRNLSVYLTPGDGFAAARRGAIQSAIDLFGECSPQMITTINAWYACGVGNPYTGTLEANFYSADTNSCTIPAEVDFTNLSLSGLHYFWDFGDGSTSTDENPSHIYNNIGSYTVTLIAYGCNGLADTLVLPDRIVVDLNQPCAVNMPASDTLLLSACQGFLYDAGGADNYLPNHNSSVTLDPVGNAQVTLTFTAFDYAAGDRVVVYDGPTSASPQLGIFTGSTLPPAMTSSNGSLTVRESTNGSNNRSGFVANWSCLVGVDPAGAASAPQVYPNPTTGILQVDWNRGKSEDNAWQLHDALGRVVLSGAGQHSDIWRARIDLSALAKGMYVLKLQAGDTPFAQRIIVQ